MLLYLRGTLPKDINSFEINLEGGGDLAVHFNPRFSDGRGVVLNTRENGEWQAEEKVNAMPFRKGESFELVFNVTSEGYQVNVDGRELHMYKHRVPLEQVTDLVIVGDVLVQTINIIMDQEVIPGYPGPEDEQGLIQEYPGPGDVSSTPLSKAIDGGLKPGTSLYFQGKVHSEINRFHINLEAGSDIAMHFKVNFKYTELLAFNTLLNRGWQIEEKLGQMPFRKGQDFDLLISDTLKGYQVIVNGCMIHMYKHRIPLDRVTSLTVGGDVSVKSIAIIKGSTGDEVGGGSWYNWRFLPMMDEQPIYNPPIPYTRMIPGGLTPMKTIAFSGRVLPDAEWIVFNFNVSSSGDLALHFNPRLNEGSVVRNSYLRGTWGAEERDVKFNPFRQGRYFEILIRCETQKLMFFGNGKHMFDFYHRFQPFTKIDTLHISGGVQLSHILL
ncbi:galectin-4-like [Anguilla rostrata]|uniref:galectin-4-like n=1 Tax=Anguilla rostrata TaxID=7938 RepID=UPI0030CCDB2A